MLPRSKPDLDGVACAVAYAEFLRAKGTPALPWYSGMPDAEARYVISVFGDVYYASEEEVGAATSFVLVDASGIEGFPERIDRSLVTEVIDHRFHHDPRLAFPNAKIQVEAVGSAATLITEKFMSVREIPTRSAGSMIYGAIHSNTQRLRGSITSDRDHKASSWLEQNVALPPDLLDLQFAARKEDILSDLPAAIARDHKSYSHNGVPFAIAQLEFEGAEEAFSGERDEIYRAIASLSPPTMLNLVDLKTSRSILVVPDERVRNLTAEALGIRFVGDLVVSDKAVLRKQILDTFAGHSR